MAFVFGGLFNTPLAIQLPWITLGLITFGFMASVMTESSTVLIHNKSLMLQQRMSVSIWSVFVTLRNLITGAHHLIVFVALVLIMKLEFSAVWLLAIPGIAIVSVFSLGLGLLVSVGSTRFRDLPPLLNNVHTVGLLAVPVLWRPDDLQRYREIADYNPVTYLMAVVREPLLGHIPDSNTYMIAIVSAVIALVAGLWVLAATRRRIMLWL
jgi:lipopolysaccharide transport system permease protein